MEKLDLHMLHMGPAPCGVDLGDGSERGEYVNQDYILQKLGRPHRNINLMYCYYPLDKGWPARASDVFPNVGDFAWGYPYDDYLPYRGGPGGNTQGEPFVSMRDIRRHGQDVTLTLTIDPHVSDDHLVQIARELRPFGRMHFRINHECDGNWFSFNKRCSYQEVGDFFVRFHRIIKREAPQIKTVFCCGGVESVKENKIHYEAEFTRAIQETDIWSVDHYLSLHWGWPFDLAEPGGKTHNRDSVARAIERSRLSYVRFAQINGGGKKPMVLSELNTDGDVVGQTGQAGMIRRFYDRIKREKPEWCSGITFYQFRDRGRLGLEAEDPNNREVGIEQPVLAVYRRIIADPYFQPVMQEGRPLDLPARLRWGGAEDADGFVAAIDLAKQPVFCEVSFPEPLNLMLEINGRWFYKAPSTKTVDLVPAFFARPLRGPARLGLKIFAPPATGENDPAQGKGWEADYHTEITEPPSFRIRYEPAAKGIYRPD